MEGVIQGEQTIGYGVFGSYAHVRARRVPDLGVVMPSDYTLILSRVAFVTAKARRPNAARLFLDYLLSQRGQTIIAGRADLYAMRHDVSGEMTSQGLAALLAPLLLVFYQSFLTAPFFAPNARLGLDAYAFVFNDPDFWSAFGTTLLLAPA